MKQSLDIIGATDIVDLPDLGWFDVPVRIDSGATTSSIHCSRVRLIKGGDQPQLCFYLDAKRGAPQQSFTVTDFKETIVRNSSGKEEKRYVIKTKITIFGKKIRTEFSLANRRKMRYPILLGRKLLKKRFLVDVSQKDLSATKRSKASHRSHVRHQS
ncbi:RimK/LysX family protein [Dyadobacter chenwenxiniae]|uniref:RimK/LysX family protein n=1 Tax=Dyadobacter chenwenxiniae TaxID=2906456 RepID=A0A9X1PQB8_9BACT|nr:RimK/LysX family protein [Dyadobacter chenwenxiniae]MCF0050914.1 RimK/LysX family protein [Dyadobacter chenwenxiniae]MCF0064199.1 RimK/LysX family protein [Dyadobacter chenwenxiniae]UON82584.1 RimK/LysX family protein [Dyadobacter chenwenxiniae]